MEVTRKNFKESLPLIHESISKADFLVIDTEFTGLMNGRDVCMFDSPAEYYNTILNGVSDFLLIQYGLCAFCWDATLQHYKNESYNFYLFPRRPGPEKLFLCQSSSLDFLASQGFDFNKLIREGISFMTMPTEKKLRDSIMAKQKASGQDMDTLTVPEENKDFIEKICTKVRTFLNENKTNEMEVERCNAFMRKLLHQELKLRFKNEIYLHTVELENKDRVMKICRLTDEHNKLDRDKQRAQKEWDDFEDAVGFSKVARMISESEKLVIGHNMLLDMIHTLNHFFQPLKSMNYKEFKQFTHAMFPRILDTKYMSTAPPFKDKVNSTVLRHLFQTVSEAPFTMPKVECEPGRGYASADEKHHEAGYDAYITGLCFLSMHGHVRRDERVNTLHHALLPYLNKLYLARTAPADSPFINLYGSDPSPSRHHVFHLTFPKEWQRNLINDLFEPFGQVTVQFLDDTSAIVVLSKREKARYVLRAFSDSKVVKVIPFESYKRFGIKSDERHIEEMEQQLMKTKAMLQAKTQEACRPPENISFKQLKRKSVLEKGRSRSDSFTSVVSTPVASPPATVTRKRVSSGVFQVDDVEPPAKKEKEVEILMNKEAEEKEKVEDDGDSVEDQIDNGDTIEDKKEEKQVVTDFDSDGKDKCVKAFKESDSWD